MTCNELTASLCARYGLDDKGIAERLHIALTAYHAGIDNDSDALLLQLRDLARQLERTDGICLAFRYLRERLGMKRNAFAEVTGIQVPSLQKIERGNNLPSLTSVRAAWAIFHPEFPTLRYEDFAEGRFQEILKCL
jgi:DNA-binding XRE family transcriptional regulator